MPYNLLTCRNEGSSDDPEGVWQALVDHRLDAEGKDDLQ